MGAISKMQKSVKETKKQAEEAKATLEETESQAEQVKTLLSSNELPPEITGTLDKIVYHLDVIGKTVQLIERRVTMQED